jgi:hypothetical protein
METPSNFAILKLTNKRSFIKLTLSVLIIHHEFKLILPNLPKSTDMALITDGERLICKKREKILNRIREKYTKIEIEIILTFFFLSRA